MFDPFGPGNIGNMNQAVDAFVDADKKTEIGNILDFTLDGGTHGIFLADHVPWDWGPPVSCRGIFAGFPA